MAVTLDNNQCTKISVGEINPKRLHNVPKDEFQSLVGEVFARGFSGVVYEKKGDPTRLYKVMRTSKFDGNEIRAAKIAGKIGVAPAYHGSFTSGEFVVIEMDKGDPTLLDQILSEANLDTETVQAYVEQNCGDQAEQFYYRLFKKIKLLADNGVIASDLHNGNILFDRETRKFKLIDFGEARIVRIKEETPSTARWLISRVATESFSQSWNFKHLLRQFMALPNLSQKSRDLIHWFETLPGMKKILSVNSISE